MSEKRFVILDSSVEEYVESLENKNTQGKTKRDLKLLNEKKEEQELSAITPEDLDRYLAEFIRSVRHKDGGEYEPSSLRSLLASVERHLKKNCYPASVFSDRQFELTRRCLQSNQKELKKAGRGNKDKAAAPLTDQEIDVLDEKNLLGLSSGEALLNTLWLNNTIR